MLGELAATRERYYGRALADVADAAEGLGDAELKRLKYQVTNLKGGVLEMGAHARFVAGACALAGRRAAHRLQRACAQAVLPRLRLRLRARCAALNENTPLSAVAPGPESEQVRPYRLHQACADVSRCRLTRPALTFALCHVSSRTT